MTLIEYENAPSKIIQWIQLIEGDPFGEHEISYRINYGSEINLRSFKVKLAVVLIFLGNTKSPALPIKFLV
ncbi:hypothetical protein [Saccharolobus shibatae]|uniref:Uncharacterized protein n=1 Tax=Saccharolobus shibatae TaxID=2286 RepID=A0A8F5GWH5_9CREN|nr:hypothetical protein [Saccharolobus shibatae]QXJ31442.1 hypothetical protein J5U21_01092 [Saccharolobus shibatae]